MLPPHSSRRPHLHHLSFWALAGRLAVACLALAVPGHGFKLYDGYYNSLFRPVIEQSFKAKVETLGAVLKRHVQQLRSTQNRQVRVAFRGIARAAVEIDTKQTGESGF